MVEKEAKGDGEEQGNSPGAVTAQEGCGLVQGLLRAADGAWLGPEASILRAGRQQHLAAQPIQCLSVTGLAPL